VLLTGFRDLVELGAERENNIFEERAEPKRFLEDILDQIGFFMAKR
jgi:hypothetical protein